MRFVSRNHPYGITIQTGSSRMEQVGADGDWERVWKHPFLQAEFQLGYLLPHNERVKAHEHFDAAVGLDPYHREAGVIGCGDPEVDGMVYQASRSMLRLSVFDTANPSMCPPEHRELFEQKLLASADLIHSMIRVDDVAKDFGAPFPRYAEMTPDEIMQACELTGAWDAVAEYEAATLNRADVLEAVSVFRDDEAAAIDEAMSEPAAPARRGRPPGSKNKSRTPAGEAPREGLQIDQGFAKAG